MAYYFRYSVREKAHPRLGSTIQTSSAQVIVLEGSGDCQQLARIELEAMGFDIEALHDSWLLTPDWLDLLTPDLINAFQNHPERRIYVQFGEDEIEGEYYLTQ